MLCDTIIFPRGMPLYAEICHIEDYPFHFHDSILEIIFVLEGDFDLSVVNNTLTMQKGDIYICSPHEIHRLHAHLGHTCTVLLLYIDPSVYLTEFPDICSYQFANICPGKNLVGMDVLGAQLRKLLPQLFSIGDAPMRNLRKAGEEIIGILVENFQCYYIAKFYPEFNNTYKENAIQLERVRRVIGYIYANYNKPIRVDDVAVMEHISPNHLTHILKSCCGLGFRMFLNMARVEQSAALLLGSDDSLQTIAYECGFSKQKYFNESFAKVFRMTPAEYRVAFRKHTIERSERKTWAATESEFTRILASIRTAASSKVHLDFSNISYEAVFDKECKIVLPWPDYEHCESFHLLKQMGSILSNCAFYIPAALILKYKNRSLMLRLMLSDIRSLGARLRVFTTASDSVQDMRQCMDALLYAWKDVGLEPMELCVLPDLQADGCMAHDMYCGADGDKSRAATWEESVSKLKSHGFSVYISELSYVEANADQQTAISMPSYMLDSMARDEARMISLDELIYGVGIRTPLYSLMSILVNMGVHLIAKGDCYLVTQGANKKNIQVLAYNYRESAQMSGADLEISFCLSPIHGRYLLTRYQLSPDTYNLYEHTINCLRSSSISENSLCVLNDALGPVKSLSVVTYQGSAEIRLRLVASEVIMLSLESI